MRQPAEALVHLAEDYWDGMLQRDPTGDRRPARISAPQRGRLSNAFVEGWALYSERLADELDTRQAARSNG